jgi:hypothetical protein
MIEPTVIHRCLRTLRFRPAVIFVALFAALGSSTLGLAQPPATSQPATSQPVVTPFRDAVETRHSQPYPGLELTYLRYEQPRPLRVWVARIDLRVPGVEFRATCGADVGPEWETRSELTPEFAARRGVQLAVNASAFDPLRPKSGEPMQVIGIGACDGKVYSPPDIIANPPYDVENIDEAVSGFHMLIENGRDVVDRTARKLKPAFVGVNPRTAAGIDKEGTTLFLAVFDGRQPGVSEGITLYELGRFFLDLGAYQALNLDGGGSTTMVLQNPKTGEYEVVNTPSGRTEDGAVQLRRVANNLGVCFPHAPVSRPGTTQSGEHDEG